jgi:hypothetical protein
MCCGEDYLTFAEVYFRNFGDRVKAILRSIAISYPSNGKRNSGCSVVKFVVIYTNDVGYLNM